jgi:hypothetical protein
VGYSYFRHFARLLTKAGSPLKSQISRATTSRESLREDIALALREGCPWQDRIFQWLEAANSVFAEEVAATPGTARLLPTWLGRYLTPMALPNALKIMSYMDGGTLSVEQGDVRSVRPCSKGSHGWSIDYGKGENTFEAVICATGFDFPLYTYEGRTIFMPRSCIEGIGKPVRIASNYSMNLPYLEEQQSIWCVGPGLHQNVFAAGALFIIISQARAVVKNIVKATQ